MNGNRPKIKRIAGEIMASEGRGKEEEMKGEKRKRKLRK